MKRIVFLVLFLAATSGVALAQWAVVLGSGRASAVTDTIFVTSNTTNDRSGSYGVGMNFTVGASDKTITALGRIISATGNKTRSLYIYNYDNSGAYTQLGSTTVSTNGAAVGDYVWGTLSSPVTVLAGHKYIVFSSEYADDIGWNNETAITTVAGFTVNSSNYAPGSFPPAFADWSAGTSGAYNYAGINFKFH